MEELMQVHITLLFEKEAEKFIRAGACMYLLGLKSQCDHLSIAIYL